MVKGMLKSRLVEGVLALVHGLTKGDVIPRFFENEEEVDGIVLSSFHPYGLARLLRDYGEEGKRFGAVVRSCDARAMIELFKRSQLRAEDVYLVGVGCYGVTELGEEEIFIHPQEMEIGGKAEPLREELILPHCRRCEHPVPFMADVSVLYRKDGLAVIANTQKGKEILASAGISEEGEADVPDPVKERARKSQEEDFSPLKEMRAKERLSFWLKQFDKCIKCYGCRDVCPLCYCKDCYIEGGRGLIKEGETPPERLFHLVRLAHVADSCVNCGQCERVCPMEIPISTLYHMVYKELSRVFGYESGTDLYALPPLGFIPEEDMA